MSAIDKVIKSEIVRLARREARRIGAPLREEIRRLKVRDSERKSRIIGLEEKIRRMEAGRRLAETTTKAATGEVKGRLSPRLIKSLRLKLGLSQSGFARLLEVSTLTIGNWEHGKANPRPEMRAKILSFRGMGRREAKTIVANLFQKDKPAVAKAVTGKKAGKRRSPQKARPRKRTK